LGSAVSIPALRDASSATVWEGNLGGKRATG
jgi:hypothetical protein